MLAWRLAASLAAIIAVLALGWALRPGRGASSVLGVQVKSGGSLRSLDGRGTDVSALIDNPNRVPVDVTVSVQGYDIGDHLVVEQTIGPSRCGESLTSYRIPVIRKPESTKNRSTPHHPIEISLKATFATHPCHVRVVPVRP